MEAQILVFTSQNVIVMDFSRKCNVYHLRRSAGALIEELVKRQVESLFQEFPFAREVSLFSN